MSQDINRSELFTGTMAVAEKQRFDIAALESYLRAHVDGFAGPLTVEQFKGGQSNPTFKLITPHRSYVMRCKPGPVAKLLPSAHAIEREFRVMRALSGSDVPVPAMHVLCEDEAVLGRAFYVMDFVEGRVLWEPQLPGLSSTQRAAIFGEMNRVMAALHQVDFAAAGIADYGKHDGYLSRQIARWTKQYRASETESIASMDALIEWLPAHIPAGEETSIVHGDYRLDNVIFHPTEPRILAVLDWELSTLGHPLADFAYHCMTWYLPPGAGRGLAGYDLAGTGIPSVKDYIAMYCQRTGRSDGIPHFEFYMAFNMFRMAGILQGIMKRVVDGTAASAQALQMGKATRPIADEGWRVAQSIR
ncbi:MAG: phosphotransferase family protein [Betaproteobacteria bacterium]|nr:MAG: phosphotransferase family protein [Betaproteobacteria bacterium]